VYDIILLKKDCGEIRRPEQLDLRKNSMAILFFGSSDFSAEKYA